MRGRVLRLLLPIFTALFGVLMLSGPVFATPTTPTPEGTTSQTETTAEETDNTTPEEESNPTCYDQVGGVGWLICPGTSFLANIIDGAFGIIEQLVRVDPLPSDQSAPVYVVWSYIRNITNLVFVILLLIIVYSQITGLGISNYGIKRTLPRLIIVAIAVNLSFIICTLAVDLSNIIGGSLLGFFDRVLEDAVTNSQIKDFSSTISVAGIVATILGIGTVGSFAALTLAGGFSGVIWALIPIVLAGAIAVVSAVITMAARQALILLLAMISPLAIVCCLLPNTNRWYQQWLKLFISMIVFYPMFSVLYGASRLAGAVIISSAENWLTAVLGVAVQVLPLFFSIPLLKMSNTVLGRIDGMVKKATSPVDRFARNYSNERRAIARQRQLSNRNPVLPHNSLAKYLEQRRVNRKVELTERMMQNEDTYRTEAMTKQYFNSRGYLNRRGRDHYAAQAARFENTAQRKLYEAKFDSGFDIADVNNPLAARKISEINKRYKKAITDDSIASAYSSTVKYENMENRAQLIKDGMDNQHSAIYSQVMRTFNAQTSGEKQKATSAVVADAINAKARVDREAKDNYATLYNSYEPGAAIGEQLRVAFDNKDYNSMVSAIEVMAARGDHDQIGAILREKTPDIMSNSAKDKMMQKELRDVIIRMKTDDANLWAFGKANMIRSAMNGNGAEIASFIDYASFMDGNTIAGDVDAGAIKKTNVDNIIQGITDITIGKTQDRTVFNDILDMQQQGVITQQNGKLSTKFSIKQLRAAATSGVMDGEQLDALNNLVTGGIAKLGPNDAWIQSNKAAIESNIVEFLSGMSTSQLAMTKTATIISLNDALLQIDPSDARVLNGHQISGKLADALAEQSASLCRPNAVTDRNRMNAVVREMLGIEEINPNGPTHRPGGTQNATPVSNP